MSASLRCKVCQSDFRPDALKDGLCAVCQSRYPNAKSPKDIMSKDKILNQGMIGLTETDVRAIVRDELTRTAVGECANPAANMKVVVSSKGAANGK